MTDYDAGYEANHDSPEHWEFEAESNYDDSDDPYEGLADDGDMDELIELDDGSMVPLSVLLEEEERQQEEVEAELWSAEQAGLIPGPPSEVDVALFAVVIRPFHDSVDSVHPQTDVRVEVKNRLRHGQTAASDDQIDVLARDAYYTLWHASEVAAGLKQLGYPTAQPDVDCLVDLGCGCGTSLLAARDLWPHAELKYFGWDHNHHQLSLAHDLAGYFGALGSFSSTLSADFLDAVAAASPSRERLLVIASHLFQQDALAADSVEAIAVALASLTARVPGWRPLALVVVDGNRPAAFDKYFSLRPKLEGLGVSIVEQTHELIVESVPIPWYWRKSASSPQVIRRRFQKRVRLLQLGETARGLADS